MRRLSLLAGTALISLALVGGAAFAPRASAPVSALHLAAPAALQPVEPSDVTPIILAQLRKLATQSPYGRVGKTGKDFVSAWTWSFSARAAVRLYATTHDPALVDAVLAAWPRYVEAGSVYADLDGFGWYTHWVDAGWRFREAPVAGLIIQPMVELLLEAEHDPALAARLAPQRAQLLATIERGVAGLDSLYFEEHGRGWLMNMARRGPEPTNLMAAYAVPLLGLAQLTGNANYRRQFVGIARSFKAALRTSADGHLGWPYFATPTGLTQWPDPIHKTPENIEMVMAGYRAGIVFDAADVAAIAKSLTETALVWHGPDTVSVRRAMDDDAQFLEMNKADARKTTLQLGSWYVLSCATTAVAPTLDRLLPAIDSEYLRNRFVLAGLTQRWLDEAQPQSCRPPARRVAGLEPR